MQCEHVRDHLSAYLDKELTAELSSAVRAHLASCPDCRRMLEELRATADLLGRLPAQSAPSGLPEDVMGEIERRMLSPASAQEEPMAERSLALRRARLWPKALAIAACVALAAGIGLFVFFGTHGPEGPPALGPEGGLALKTDAPVRKPETGRVPADREALAGLKEAGGGSDAFVRKHRGPAHDLGRFFAEGEAPADWGEGPETAADEKGLGLRLARGVTAPTARDAAGERPGRKDASWAFSAPTLSTSVPGAARPQRPLVPRTLREGNGVFYSYSCLNGDNERMPDLNLSGDMAAAGGGPVDSLKLGQGLAEDDYAADARVRDAADVLEGPELAAGLTLEHAARALERPDAATGTRASAGAREATVAPAAGGSTLAVQQPPAGPDMAAPKARPAEPAPDVTTGIVRAEPARSFGDYEERMAAKARPEAVARAPEPDEDAGKAPAKGVPETGEGVTLDVLQQAEEADPTVVQMAMNTVALGEAPVEAVRRLATPSNLSRASNQLVVRGDSRRAANSALVTLFQKNNWEPLGEVARGPEPAREKAAPARENGAAAPSPPGVYYLAHSNGEDTWVVLTTIDDMSRFATQLAQARTVRVGADSSQPFQAIRHLQRELLRFAEAHRPGQANLMGGMLAKAEKADRTGEARRTLAGAETAAEEMPREAEPGQAGQRLRESESGRKRGRGAGGRGAAGAAPAAESKPAAPAETPPAEKENADARKKRPPVGGDRDAGTGGEQQRVGKQAVARQQEAHARRAGVTGQTQTGGGEAVGFRLLRDLPQGQVMLIVRVRSAAEPPAAAVREAGQAETAEPGPSEQQPAQPGAQDY